MAGPIALAINERATEAEVFAEDGALCVRLDGTVHRTELLRTNQSGLYSLLVDGRSWEVFVRERPGVFELLIGNRVYEVRVGRGQARPGGADDGVSGVWTLTSPMAGQVVELRVQDGDAVEVGQTLAVVESMKMNNELIAARAGQVRDVQVAPGDRVEKGRALLRVE